MYTLDIKCCSIFGRIKFLHGFKNWIFPFFGVLSMFQSNRRRNLFGIINYLKYMNKIKMN